MQINLQELISLERCLTSYWREIFYRASIFMMERNNHNKEGTNLVVTGDVCCSFNLLWPDSVSDVDQLSWGKGQDITKAIEFGAIGITILIVDKQTEYVVKELAGSPTGFDYYLGRKEDESSLYQKCGRLEISGINSDESISSRFAAKSKQVRVSDSMEIPAYVSVIKFREPMAKFGNIKQ